LVDETRDLAPHELRLDSVHARNSALNHVLGGQLPEAPFPVCAGSAGRRLLRGGRIVAGRVRAGSWSRSQLNVGALGVLRRGQPILAGQRRIARQWQSFGVEVVVDLAVACGIPAPAIAEARSLAAALVVAQEMTHLVYEEARVLLDAVGR